jgi:hypothetical protein
MGSTRGLESSPVGPVSRKGWVLFVAALVAISLAIVAPISPWYSISTEIHDWTVGNSTFDLNSTTTFYPGENYRFFCTTYPVTAPTWGPLCTLSHEESGGTLQPYPDIATLPPYPASNDLSILYSLVWLLSFFSISIGFFGFALFLLDERQRKPDWRVTLGASIGFGVAAIFALGTAVGVAVLQPSAVVHDYTPIGERVVAGSSFWGACGPSSTECGTLAGALWQSGAWGPALGWFVELASGLVFLALTYFVLREALRRRRIRRLRSSASVQP